MTQRDVSTMTLTPRPTTYRGVSMRSRLEAAWAQQFDAWRWPWAYEPQAFGSEDGQYLPDFRLDVPAESPWYPEPLGVIYAEVKPGRWFASRVDWVDEAARWARILRASDPRASLVVCTVDAGRPEMWTLVPPTAADEPDLPLETVPALCPSCGTVVFSVAALSPWCHACGERANARLRLPVVDTLYATGSFTDFLGDLGAFPEDA